MKRNQAKKKGRVVKRERVDGDEKVGAKGLAVHRRRLEVLSRSRQGVAQAGLDRTLNRSRQQHQQSLSVSLCPQFGLRSAVPKKLTRTLASQPEKSVSCFALASGNLKLRKAESAEPFGTK